MLNKTRALARTPTESTGHLPTSGRSSPVRFRRQLSSRSWCSLSTSSCRSCHSAGVRLNKEQEVREIKQTPDITKSSSYRRLGDLTEDEQRSVLALICRNSAVDERQVCTFVVNRDKHDIHADIEQNVTVTQAIVSQSNSSSIWTAKSTKEKRRYFSKRLRASTSSLPDVFEETGSFSVKSFSCS